MKNIFILSVILTNFLNAQPILDKCFSLPKEDFVRYEERMIEYDKWEDSLVSFKEDILVSFFKSEYGSFTMDISLNEFVPYSSGAYFECYKSENNLYSCSQDDDGGSFNLKYEDDKLFVDLDYGRIADSLDNPVVNSIKEKKENQGFIKAKEIICNKEAKVKNELYKKYYNYFGNIEKYSIYTMDIKDEVIIAVGERNTKEVQKQQAQDEYHEGLFLISRDSGKTWVEIDLDYGLPYHDVLIIDKNSYAIAASHEGAGGEVLVTSDGGKTWYSGSTGMIHSIEYIDGEIVVILSTVPKKIVSKDMGKTWLEKDLF